MTIKQEIPSFEFGSIVTHKHFLIVTSQIQIGDCVVELHFERSKNINWTEVQVTPKFGSGKILFRLVIDGRFHKAICIIQDGIIKRFDGTIENAYLTTCMLSQFQDERGSYSITEELIDFLYRLVVYLIERRPIEIYTKHTRDKPILVEYD